MTYLELFHGRNDATEELDDWGFEGPVFPVDYVHTTYVNHIRLKGPDMDEAEDLTIVNDLLYYDGKFYGDWSVFNMAKGEARKNFGDRIRPFNFEKAVYTPRIKECGCCGAYHLEGYCGDCRNDEERYANENDACRRLKLDEVQVLYMDPDTPGEYETEFTPYRPS